MAESRYTEEQLKNADEMAKVLSELPKEKQATVAMMANAFIAGMEAQARMTAAKAQANG